MIPRAGIRRTITLSLHAHAASEATLCDRLLIGGVEQRYGTTATLEQFAEAVKRAQGTSLVFHRPFLDMKG